LDTGSRELLAGSVFGLPIQHISVKYLIAGLGNIGEEYANTRHNIGFIVLDALAQWAGVSFSTHRYASTASFRHKGRTFFLIKPSTYMNLSGKAVKYWMNKEQVPLENLLVVVDDIALALGTLRMKAKGSDGGHNGLISIIESLETTEFPRLRIGIGDDYAKGYQVEYVLTKWTKGEEEILIPKIKLAAEMILSFGTIGLERTMNMFN
jgi:PTH1 family peptidyl-tRNA hydrolase